MADLREHLCCTEYNKGGSLMFNPLWNNACMWVCGNSSQGQSCHPASGFKYSFCWFLHVAILVWEELIIPSSRVWFHGAFPDLIIDGMLMLMHHPVTVSQFPPISICTSRALVWNLKSKIFLGFILCFVCSVPSIMRDPGLKIKFLSDVGNTSDHFGQWSLLFTLTSYLSWVRW